MEAEEQHEQAATGEQVPGTRQRRLVSVDALRGAAVAAMVFFNNTSAPEALPPLLTHARWHGYALPDGVFPLFLFVVGTSMALSAARRAMPNGGETRKMLERVGMLLALGLLLNLVLYGLPMRYPGILQRIALAALFAMPLVRARTRTVLIWAGVLLAVHTWILLGVSVPDIPAGTLERGRNIAGWIDVYVLGRQHLLGSGFDPEGLLGVLTSAGEVLLGLAAGQVLVRHPDSASRRIALGGVLLLILAAIAVPALPVNKRLFTASFVALTAGVNMLLLAVLHEFADRRGRQRLVRPLVPLGRNAIVVYVGAVLLSAGLRAFVLPLPAGPFSPRDTLLVILGAAVGPALGSITFSLGHVATWWAIAAEMDRRRLYVRL